MTQKTEIVRKLDGLQIGRLLAAFFVVLYHAAGRVTPLSDSGSFQFEHYFRGGNAGVDLFFVISGFVIMHAHREDIGSPQALPIYLYRRATRIYPIFWLLCGIVIPLYFAVPSAGDGWQRNSTNILATIFLFPMPPKPIIGVAWTLVLEVIFYAMFALAIAGGRLGKIIFIGWLLLASLSHFYPAPQSYLLRTFLNDHFFGFLVGMLVAVTWRSVSQLMGRFMLAAGLIAFFAAWGYIISNGASHENRPVALEILIDGSCGAIILGLASGNLSFRSPVGKAAVMMGDATYSIYLFHWLFGWFVEKFLTALQLQYTFYPWFVFLSIVAGMLASGLIVHQLVEKPLQNLFRTLGQRHAAPKTSIP